MVNDRSIVIRKADKGSRVVVWDPEHYIVESEKHLSDKHVFRDVGFKSKILQELAETNDDFFKNLKRKGKLTEKELKCFIINYEKAIYSGKIYLLLKIIQCAGETSHFQLRYTLRESF